ncbi:MAG: hypothetical protein ACI4K7_05905 [Oscillospiraceae bacterium]
MEKISDFKLLAKTERLLMDRQNASAEDFAALEEELIRASDNAFFDRFSFQDWNFVRYDDFDNMLEDSVIEFLSEYARRYPEEFLRHDHKKLRAPLAHALMPCIIAGGEQAETMADALFIEPIDDRTASYAIACGVMSENLGFLEYLLGMYEIKDRFFECFCMDTFARASDMGIEGMFDDMLESASYKDIAGLIKSWNMLGLYPFAAEGQRICRYEIEYIYELVSRSPAAWEGRSVADTVDQLIYDCNIHSSFKYDFYADDTEQAAEQLVHAWDFMKEKDLRFRTLDALPQIYGSNNSSPDEKNDLLFLKEHLFPVFDERLYVTLNEYYMNSSLVMDIIGEIGSDRIALDCTSRRNILFDEMVKTNVISPLIRKGVKVLLDDDIRNSEFVFELLYSCKGLLELMLKKGVLSDEQIDIMTDMCTQKKLLDALNVIRKDALRRKGEK